jgi:acyl-CoA thioesterase-2
MRNGDKSNANNRQSVNQLQKLLELEKIEHNLFRGISRFSPAPQVYGGQVMGQALMAAYQCVEDEMRAHSVHCYFLRGGDMKSPIIYEVERTRDGRTFSSRRVIAIQHGKQIFNMSVSFQKPEKGFDHQKAAPDSPDPSSLPSSKDLQKKYHQAAGWQYTPEKHPSWFFDIRIDGPAPQLQPEPRDPEFKIWFKLKEEFVEHPSFHEAALAYASDLRLLGVSLMPHAVPYNQEIRVATIDHSIWFHRDFDIREWQLFHMQSPNACGGRGFSIGHIYSQTGILIASCTQEGLIRQVNKN